MTNGFRLVHKLNNCGVIRIYPARILISTIKSEPKVISVLDQEFRSIWKLEIDKYARCIPLNENEAMVIDNRMRFISLRDGKVISEEKAKIYLSITESFKAWYSPEHAECTFVQFIDKVVQLETGTPNSLYFFNDHLIQFVYDEKVIRCFTLQDGKVVWELNLRDLLQSGAASLYSEIIFFEGCLFFFVSDLHKKAVFKAEVTTGLIIKRLDDSGGWLTLANDRLYFVDHRNLCIMNPDTFEAEVLDFSKTLGYKNITLQWNKFLVVNDLLYFVHENLKGGDEAIVGVLSISTREFLWSTVVPIEDESFWIAGIKVFQNRLFVETQGGNVYVFESVSGNI
jgi:hypothetical protein